MKSTTRGFLFLAFVLAVLPIALPNAYYYDLAIRMAINATIAVGLNLLVGYTGQISLGHAGFFGIGAYVSAVLTSRYGLPSGLALVIGATATAALAFVVARPILKLKGNYLAMATLGLGIILSMVIVNETELTGGPDGMSVDAFSLFGLQVAGEQAWYGVVAVLLLLVTRGALNLIDAPAGRALQAIHGSEVAARVAGIDVASFKVRVFVLSAVIASVMGSVTAHYVGFLTPGVAGFFHSIELITMVVLGGMASVFGSILGAVVLTLLPQLLSAFEGWETVIFGLILMFTMIFLPRGIVPTLRLKFAGRAA